jgi:hypothetical protein
MQFPQPIETRHPYFDRRLVEMVMAMPQNMKLYHEETVHRLNVRFHHRQALAGIMPDEVRLGNGCVDFMPVFKRSFVPKDVRYWLMKNPVVHIFERGYVIPDQFMKAVNGSEYPPVYLSGMICLEGWLRALDEEGALYRLVDTGRSSRQHPPLPYSPEVVRNSINKEQEMSRH